MERKPLVSSLVLGLFLAFLSGYAWAGVGGGVDTMPAEQATDALMGEELPFPVGWVPESALPTAGYEIEGPSETGALPESGEAAFELRGTELPFPVGWVPE